MVTMASSVTTPDVSTVSPTVQKKASENRRSNKPIMEKRRRARINNSLNDLKALILDAMRKDPSRHSKLEKADILEMAVKHLRSLHSHHSALSDQLDKYRAGFSECASEVERYSGLDVTVRRRLVHHLNNYLNSANIVNPNQRPLTPMSTEPTSGLRPATALRLQQHQSVMDGPIFLSSGANAGVQLVPTRLPNGELALILPSVPANNFQQRLAASPAPSSSSSSPPPLTMINHSRSASSDSVISSNSPLGFDRLSVNIPPSSSSMEDIHSPSSAHSNYSSPRSPESVHSHYENYRLFSPEPLSLVVREKDGDKDSDKQCWRPW